jgi:hypothetical protein
LRLEEIFQEAKTDHGSANLDGDGHESRMMHGVKISRDILSEEIKIFNPRGKDYDEELTSEEYLIFNQGWRKGVYRLVLQVYRKRLDIIEKRIPELLNNKKSLESIKERRTSLIKKYFKITQKLNQLL